MIGSRPSLADFLPSSARPRRINFRVGRRFYGGSRTRNYRKEEDSREKEEEKLLCRCPAFLIHLSLLEKGRIHPPPLPPLLKRVYTHLLASICKSNLLSFNHRLLDGGGSVKGWATSGSVLTIDRIKSLSSRPSPLNLHEPPISTAVQREKKKIGHNCIETWTTWRSGGGGGG